MKIFKITSRYWNDLPVRTKGIVVILLPLCAFLATTLLIYAAKKQEGDAAAWVSHTLQVYSETRSVRELLTESEASVRQYALDGENASLDTYKSNRAALPGKIDHIATLVQDSPQQLSRIRRIQGEATQSLALLDRTRNIYAADRDPSLAESTVQVSGAEKQAMEAIRNDLQAVLDAETALLPRR